MIKQVRTLISVFDKSTRLRYYCNLVLSMISPVLDLFSFSMLFPILRSVVDDGDVDSASKKLLGLGVLMIFKGAYDVLMVRMQASWQSEYNHKLSTMIYELMLNEDLMAHSSRSSGQALQQTRKDVGTALLILVHFKNMLVGIVLFFGCAGLVVVISGLIGTAAFVVLGLLLGALMFINRKKMRRLGAENHRREIELACMVVNSYYSYKEVARDSRKNNLIRKYSDLSEGKEETIKTYLFYQSLSGAVMQNITQAVVFFALAAILMLGFDISSWASALILMLTFLSKMLPSARSIVSSMNDIRYCSIPYESVMANYRAYRAMKEDESRRAGLRHRPLTLEKGIVVSDVSFGYGEGPLIFKDLNMEIPAGSTVAITGPSGSGKTTLLDLILSLLRPKSGSIFYDDYDIVAEADAVGPCIADMGPLVSYMPQYLSFQDDTIRNIISFMEVPGAADEERIIECLKTAMLYDDVMELPDGLDTLIGSGGIRLSGGQYQRLGLARALYKDFTLLVMDEGTASLDSESEAAVFDALRAVGGGRTLVLVTHHRELAERCDIIYEVRERYKTVVRVK